MLGQAKQEPAIIESDRPITREIGSGEEHTYQIKLIQGQQARIVLEQRGVDVVVSLSGADNLLIDFDNESRTHGKEEVEFVAETSGAYALTVKTRLKGVQPGTYEIRIVETRAATDSDRSLQEARKLETQFVRLQRAGKYDEARPFVERALVTAEKVLGSDHVFVGQLVTELGNSYLAKHDSQNAGRMYERALAIFEKELGAEHPRTAYVANHLGGVRNHFSEVAEADKLFNQALAVSEKALGPEHPQVSMCLRSMADLYDVRGDTAKAEQLYLRALAMAEKTLGSNDPFVAELLNVVGVHYLDKNDEKQADSFLRRSLALNEKLFGPEHLELAGTLVDLGLIARGNKDYDKAMQYYLRALTIFEKSLGPEHPDIPPNLINIANLYRSKGDYAKALEIHLRALKILEKTAGTISWVTVVSLANIARTYWALGDITNAITFQSRVDAALEKHIGLNIAIGSERQKLAFLDTISSRTDRTISLNVQSASGNAGASSLAALVVLQRKGRVLDAMTDTLAALQQRSNAQDRLLLDQLNQTRAQLAQLILKGSDKIPHDEYQKTVQDLEEKKEQLEADISRESAEFRAQARPVTLAAVQAAIPENAALVEFVAYRSFDAKAENSGLAYGETRYAAYVIRRTGPPQSRDLGEAKVIDSSVEALRQALRDPLRRDARELARSVDQKVMAPVRALLGDATQLLVSPDGALNLIPFEALADEHDQYLVQRYSFAYLTSGRDLLRMQVVIANSEKPLVVANPSFGEQITGQFASTVAPRDRRRSVTAARSLAETYFAPLAGTAQEAQMIHTLFPNASLLTGAQATESAIKAANAPRILHIATHGFFLQEGVAITPAGAQRTTQSSAGSKIQNPLLRSGLALAGANLRNSTSNDDGILTALEASGLNLWGTKLVVLSACDTGVGDVRNREGVYGLRRAFVLAGAESLVMSLWPASDYSTRTLMTSYYKNLKQGLGRGESLRQVQLEMLKKDPQLHPFYWANFIQSGEWANLDGKR